MTTQAELAKLIDRSRAAVSQATKEGHLCAGYPIAEWAEFTASGRVKGYHVPAAVRAEWAQSETETGHANADAANAKAASAGRAEAERPNPPSGRHTPRRHAPGRLSRNNRALSNHSVSNRSVGDHTLGKRGVSVDGTTGPSSPTAPSPRETAAAKPEEEHDNSPHSPAESGEFSRDELPQLALLRIRERLKRQEPSTQPQRTAPAEPTDLPVDVSKPVDAPKQIDASSRTALLPEGQDYFRPVAAASTAHVLATIAQYDTPTARAITTTCGTAAGALLGYRIADEHPSGALIGASVGLFAVVYGMDPSAFHQ